MLKIHFLQKLLNKWSSSTSRGVKTNKWKIPLFHFFYIGETSRNFYSRSLEHIEKANSKSEDSFIYNHQRECHNGTQHQFKTKVLKTFQDPLSRQVSEGVYIRRNTNNSLNTKLDFYQTSTYKVRRDVLHRKNKNEWCNSHPFLNTHFIQFYSVILTST